MCRVFVHIRLGVIRVSRSPFAEKVNVVAGPGWGSPGVTCATAIGYGPRDAAVMEEIAAAVREMAATLGAVQAEQGRMPPSRDPRPRLRRDAALARDGLFWTMWLVAVSVWGMRVFAPLFF